MFAFTLIIFMVFILANAEGTPLSLKAEIDRQQALVGDHLSLTVTLIADSNAAIDSMPIGETIGDFDVLNMQYELSAHESGALKHVISLTVAAYKTGQLWIPQLSVTVIEPDSTATELSTDSLGVMIESLTAGDSIADIKGLKPPAYFGSRFPWLYVAIAVAVVALIAYWIWRKRKQVKEEVEVKPVDTRPVWVIAEEALKRLRESDLLPDGKFKLFYLELTNILRVYIESRFGVDALESTTSELRVALSGIGLGQDEHDLLFDLFDSADLVKFAKMIPEVSQAEADFQKGWQFVQSTSVRRTAEVAES